MAFDVVLPLDLWIQCLFKMNPHGRIAFGPDVWHSDRIRKVALFEGTDEFGRLQPLLGTAEPAVIFNGSDQLAGYTTVTPAGLVGQMEGAVAWHSPTTENPKLNTTEEWEIWNGTGDAHPVHLHLVHFEIVGPEGDSLGRPILFWRSLISGHS